LSASLLLVALTSPPANERPSTAGDHATHHYHHHQDHDDDQNSTHVHHPVLPLPRFASEHALDDSQPRSIDALDLEAHIRQVVERLADEVIGLEPHQERVE
jgi:hypothetical protein